MCHLIAVFTELRRVLRDDGLFCLNLGDSYTSGGREGHGTRVGYKQATNRGMNGTTDPPRPPQPEGLKPKDLMMIPYRVAMALQYAGWTLRQEAPWVNRSKMPESVKDRPTQAKEELFFFSKSERYFFDMDAVRRKTRTPPMSPAEYAEALRKSREQGDWNGRDETGEHKHRHVKVTPDSRAFRNSDLLFESLEEPYGLCWLEDEIVALDTPTEPFYLEHFASFPPALARALVKCGTSARGVCPACGAPWRRRVNSSRVPTRPGEGSKVNGREEAEYGNRDPQRHVSLRETVGWEPGCSCPISDPVPPLVIDPFSGAGTTALVCARFGLRCVGIELNPKYIEVSKQRLAQRGRVTKEDGAAARGQVRKGFSGLTT